MAQKKSKPDDNTKWISCDLTKEQAAHMKKVLVGWEAVGMALQNVVDAGYKFTVNIDKYNKCFSAYLFPTDEANVNFGAILTSRGSSVYAALRGMIYRHEAIYDKLWASWAKEVIDDE